MREMKDSGVAWIGEIPKEWNVVQLSSVVSERKNKNDGMIENNLLSLSYGNVKRKNINTTDGLLPANFESYNIIESGDIVLRLTDLQNDHTSLRTGLCKEKGIITSAYVTLKVNNNITSSEYLHYILHSFDCCKGLYGMGSGVRQGLNYDGIKKIVVLLPNLSEQQKIAELLDKKCTQIDTLISNQQQQIEKLKAYKQSLITEVVTKGLNPDVPMKDSGVEWIRIYPEHWSYMPFGYILHERNEKNNPVISEERLSLSIELGVTLYAEKTTNLDRFKDDFTQYKIAHIGDLVMNSMNMIVGATGVSQYFGCVSPAYYTFFDDTDNHITAKYCEYIFRSKTMLRVLHSMGKGIYSIDRGDDKINTCRLKVPKSDLKSLHIPLPPIEEQMEIVEYLDKKCSEIDSLIAIKQQKIEKLQQYKKSLIYEYVTGKKEV